MLKRKRKIDKKTLPLLVVYLLGFILAVSTALPAYIQSNFLDQFVSIKLVSLFFIIANTITIIVITFFPKLIESFTNHFVTKIIAVIYFVSLLGLVLARDPLTAFLSISLFIISSNLVWINMDIMLEGISSDQRTGRIRTTYLTFANIGWMIAPSISSYLVKLGGYSLSFLISAAVVVIFFIVFIFYGHRQNNKIDYSQGKFFKSFVKLWHDKNLRGVFYIAFLLNLFYSCAVVYIPIYLHQTLGMSWGILGIIFSIMLVPFILIEMPAGYLADKYIGEKEMMTLGISILAVSLFLFFYINTPTVWLWVSVLFLSRIGAALIESMRETYFFKMVDVEDVGYINIFRTTGPLGYIIGPALTMLILLFLPLHYIFLIIGIIVLSGFIFIYSMEDTK